MTSGLYFALLALLLLLPSCHVFADDMDDLRVSSVSHSDRNYHTINPSARARVSRDDLTINQIGKPLYMQSSNFQQFGAKKAKSAQAKPTQAPKYPTIEPDLSALDSISSYSSGNNCRWIPLMDMRNVNFDSGEMIIRDSADQPCYIMSIRAFIKFNDDAYFPLRGFKPHPSGAYKIDYFNHTGDTTVSNAPYRMPLNCSLPDTPSFLVAYDQRPSDYYLFKEEITIQLNCGYLVFKMKLDFAYQLMLEAISFYQDGEAVSTYRDRTPIDEVSHVKRKSAKSTASVKPVSMQSEHLVFTTNNTAPDSEPLLVMPLYSRYICQNRVVLTGNNSIQLVIDRFELSRLITVPNDRLRVDLKHRAHLHSKTECPAPKPPATNLTVLMETTRGDASAVVVPAVTATSGKLIAPKSSATNPQSFGLSHMLVGLILSRLFIYYGLTLSH